LIVNDHDTRWVRDWERTQQHRVDDAKDGGVGAYAKGENEYGQTRESGTPQ
jgi:hypothetical protein